MNIPPGEFMWYLRWWRRLRAYAIFAQLYIVIVLCGVCFAPSNYSASSQERALQIIGLIAPVLLATFLFIIGVYSACVPLLKFDQFVEAHPVKKLHYGVCAFAVVAVGIQVYGGAFGLHYASPTVTAGSITLISGTIMHLFLFYPAEVFDSMRPQPEFNSDEEILAYCVQNKKECTLFLYLCADMNLVPKMQYRISLRRFSEMHSGIPIFQGEVWCPIST